MTRYASIEEVNAALVDLEEHERIVNAEKANNEKHSDSEKIPSRTTSGMSVNGKSLANGIEENGLHEEIMETESDSENGTIEHVGCDDDEETDDGNRDERDDTEDESDDGDGPGSDEDDEVHVRSKVAGADPLEEAEFERELRALMQESLDSRKLELRGRPTLNMMIPMNVFEGPSKDHRGVEGESGDETLDEGAGGSKEVPVKVLVKRGSKQQTKKMLIPRDCSLIQSTKQKEAAELEEKQDIKRLVLEYNDREEEELYGLGNQPPSWTQNSGSRVAHRGNTWDAPGRGSGSRQRYLYHSGGGLYYGRRR